MPDIDRAHNEKAKTHEQQINNYTSHIQEQSFDQ